MTMLQLPDPSMRLRGTDNDHPLLRLDEDTVRIRDLLLQATHVQRDAVMMAAGASRGRVLWERMREPRVGDWVYEWMTTWLPGEHNADNRLKGFGILLGRRTEWWHTEEEWKKDQESGDPAWYADQRPSEEVWYVQYGPRADDVCRWVNCQFYALLERSAR